MKKKILLFFTIFSTYSLLLPITNKQRRAQFRQEMANRDQAKQSQEVAQDEIDSDSECPICYAHENEVVLDCGHQFCQTCIDRILNRELGWNVGDDDYIPIHKTQCPLCRANITRDSVHPIAEHEAVHQRREFYRKMRQAGRPFIPILQGGLRAFQCYYTYRYLKDAAKLWKQASLRNIKYQPAIPFDLMMACYSVTGGLVLTQHLPAEIGVERANHIAWNAGIGLMNGVNLYICGLVSLAKLIKLDKLTEMMTPAYEWQARKELFVPQYKSWVKNQSRFFLPHALGVAARYNLGTFADVQLRNGQIFTKPSRGSLLSKNGLLFAAGAAAGGYYAPQLYKATSKVADAYSSVITKYIW